MTALRTRACRSESPVLISTATRAVISGARCTTRPKVSARPQHEAHPTADGGHDALEEGVHPHPRVEHQDAPCPPTASRTTCVTTKRPSPARAQIRTPRPAFMTAPGSTSKAAAPTKTPAASGTSQANRPPAVWPPRSSMGLMGLVACPRARTLDRRHRRRCACPQEVPAPRIGRRPVGDACTEKDGTRSRHSCCAGGECLHGSCQPSLGSVGQEGPVKVP